MKTFRKLLAISALLCTASTAFGYAAQIPVRSFAAKLPSDNLVVIEVSGNTGENRQWFNSMNGFFQIWMIDNSIEVRRLATGFPGLKPGIVAFSSLDTLHDLKIGDRTKTYDMRIMFDEDLLWIEVWPSKQVNQPVRNTVMFFGPDRATYEYYLNNSLSGVSYANEHEMKTSIQANYAGKFDPDFHNLLDFRPETIATLGMVALED